MNGALAVADLDQINNRIESRIVKSKVIEVSECISG
jgi:hypothetical protein